MKINDIVYSPCKGQEVVKGTVVRVGRKYFEVKWENSYGRPYTYRIEDNSEVHKCGTADYRIYFSEQEVRDMQEYNKLDRHIRQAFSHWYKTKLTLVQLRRIYAVLMEADNG